MPTTVDLFETRTMLEIFSQLKPVRTWFLTTFFNISNTFNTEAVDVDIIKGKRRLAPFVSPKREGKVIEKRGFKTRSYRPAYIKPKMITTAEDILKRQPGQIIYAPNSGPAVMASQELGRNLAEMDEMITRREEWMAAQALITGQVNVIGDGINDVLDFHMDAENKPTLSGGSLWSAPTTAVPLDNLRTWKRLLAKKSGKSPNICLMGLSAIDAFMKCEQVVGNATGGKGMFNLRAIDIGRIVPAMLPDGVTYYGSLTELGLDIYTYEEWYVDEYDDVEYPLMPNNKVLLGSTGARCERLYGAIKDLDALAPVARFPKSWTQPDPSARFLMVQSAPLTVPIEIDAFLCATVL